MSHSESHVYIFVCMYIQSVEQSTVGTPFSSWVQYFYSVVSGEWCRPPSRCRGWSWRRTLRYTLLHRLPNNDITNTPHLSHSHSSGNSPPIATQKVIFPFSRFYVLSLCSLTNAEGNHCGHSNIYFIIIIFFHYS